MTQTAIERLFGWQAAFDRPEVAWLSGIGGAILVLSGVIIAALVLSKKAPEALRRELVVRWLTWSVIALGLVASVVAGAATLIVVVFAVSVLCYREFARATGVFREPIVTAIVGVCLLALAFAAADNWFAMFTAIPMLGAVLIAIGCVVRDQPQGYLQRVSLGVVGLLVTGAGPAYLSMLTVDERWRMIVLALFIAVAVGDVSAFVCGKLVGGMKLMPNTSPGKTIAGAVGSLIITAVVVATMFSMIYDDTRLDSPTILLGLGILVGVTGQLGDLILSALKRDVGIKDFGKALPGHGGLLDRFDSLVFTAPAVFYYLAYFVGIGLESETNILTFRIMSS
ncbi:MAG: phosphatidate cytidylyltransferase [Planctomycetota bacterium]